MKIASITSCMLILFSLQSKAQSTNHSSADETIKKQNIYQFKVKDLNENVFDFASLKGKKVMIVNTASKCGYTPQYKDLEAIYKQYKDQGFVIIGFPANNFGSQEPGTNQEIETFCKLNYGVSFPLFKKSKVITGADQNEIFQWLTQKNKNGWNEQAPSWNFCKYLIDEQGRLTNFFASSVEPSSPEVLAAINQ